MNGIFYVVFVLVGYGDVILWSVGGCYCDGSILFEFDIWYIGLGICVIVVVVWCMGRDDMFDLWI